MDVFCDEISTEIEHRLVSLECAVDIVRFSFVAQHSISPLDLSLQDAVNSFNDEFISGYSNFSILNSTVQNPIYAINTEEKCRKILSVTRDFLYRLHLDLPRKREHSLKDGLELGNMDRCYYRRHIGKIGVHPHFYFSVLSNLAHEAVKRSDKKLKIIKWLVTFDAVPENVCLTNQQVNYFANCMYPEVTESAFVRALVKKFHFNSWMIRNERPELLEYFLYHLCQKGRTLQASVSLLIDTCITRQRFLDIATILKYQDALQVLQGAIGWLTYQLPFQREGPSDDVLREAEKWMSPRRFYLMRQLLYVYFTSSRIESASKCLCLLWNSLPDVFFSFKELEKALQADVSPATIIDLYKFYSGAVGKFNEHFEPRSLKHLCRPTVRRMLRESGCWIPDGIRLTGVPEELQSFLNLEE